MILMVAPYAGTDTHDSIFIAAAKKIRLILSALKAIDENVVVLNSGHQSSINMGMTINSFNLGNCGSIDVITPATIKAKYLGRALNLYNAKDIVDDVINHYGIPSLVWCYNGYAFEMRIASILGSKHGVSTILGFEDWHFSRKRGLNPKPYFDWFFWRLAISHIRYGFPVNSYLANKLSYHQIPHSLLPGIISPEFAGLSSTYPPFSSTNVTVGYFGGLSHEKGASTFLRLAKVASKNISFIATGTGDLRGEFEAMMRLMPNRFKFLGAVSDNELMTAMAKADLIVNAHTVNEGVFPFKVLEALASGRLLISTKLPMLGFEQFSNAIQFYSGDMGELVDLVNCASDIYQSKKAQIISATEFVIKQYSITTLTEHVINQINFPVNHLDFSKRTS